MGRLADITFIDSEYQTFTIIISYRLMLATYRS